MSKRMFKAPCPVCGKIIKGYDNWDVGDICVAGYCSKCKRHYGEDEVDWRGTDFKKEGGDDERICRI